MIHPFLDGNGRMGRLLVSLLLGKRKVLGRPLLYLCPYLKARRAEYFLALRGVDTRGDWEGWLGFLFRAVAEVSREAEGAARAAGGFRRKPGRVGRSSEKWLDSTNILINDTPICVGPVDGLHDDARASATRDTEDRPMSVEAQPSEALEPIPAEEAERNRPERVDTPAAGREGAPPAVIPSGCGCAVCAEVDRSPVFAIGIPSYDLVSEARRDSIRDYMGAGADPGEPEQLLAHLARNPWDAASITWTLQIDQTPVYAIQPSGPFAAEGYLRLREFLADHAAGKVERVSIPGRLAGRVTLIDGQVVPVIQPELRGMSSWTTSALVAAVAGPAPADPKADPGETAAYTAKVEGVRNFLERVYFELRNLGVTPEERAINFAATNAFQVEKVFASAMREIMELDAIEVERSPICRPDSDCWDVKLLFFFPQRQVQTVRRVYRFTVDVSDTVPVMVGPLRSWFVR
jgi:cyanobactin maturation PatA/PatG family protease